MYKKAMAGMAALSECVSRVLRPARHMTGYFGDESFQAITCTGTDNTKKQTQKQTKYSNLIYKKQNDGTTFITAASSGIAASDP